MTPDEERGDAPAGDTGARDALAGDAPAGDSGARDAPEDAEREDAEPQARASRDETGAVVRELVSRLAQGPMPATARAELLELGLRLGATSEGQDPPAPETSGEVGPC